MAPRLTEPVPKPPPSTPITIIYVNYTSDSPAVQRDCALARKGQSNARSTRADESPRQPPPRGKKIDDSG